MKSKKFFIISLLLFVLAIGFVYYMSQDKLEDFEKLRKQLPKNYVITKAQITKMNKIKNNSSLIENTKYTDGWL